MGLLDSNSKKMLVESMRHALSKSVLGNKTLEESAQIETINYIAEQATYEQLLNLTMNPLRESKYLPDYVLEGAVAICSSAMMTGRKVIGINAITEGAMRLQKKTECVITESMLDAALELAKSNGLYVVADCLKESFAQQEKALAESAKPVLSKRGKALAESVLQEMDGKELASRIHNPTQKEFIDAVRKYEGGETKKPKVHNASWQKKAAKNRKEVAKIQADKAAKAADHAARKAKNDRILANARLAGHGEGYIRGEKIGELKGRIKQAKQNSKAAKKLNQYWKGVVDNTRKSGNKKAAIAGTAGAAVGTLAAVGLHAINKWRDKKAAAKKAKKD